MIQKLGQHKPWLRGRPSTYKFRDELSHICFLATIPFVQSGINKATRFLQETDFVALEELYSFWGLTDFINTLDTEKLAHMPDISYMDLREVLGWNLLQGIRYIDIELKPDIINEEIIINIVYKDMPEFWDVRDLLNPYKSDICQEEWLNYKSSYGKLVQGKDGSFWIDTGGYASVGLDTDQQLQIYEQRKTTIK